EADLLRQDRLAGAGSAADHRHRAGGHPTEEQLIEVSHPREEACDVPGRLRHGFVSSPASAPLGPRPASPSVKRADSLSSSAWSGGVSTSPVSPPSTERNSSRAKRTPSTSSASGADFARSRNASQRTPVPPSSSPEKAGWRSAVT